MADLLAVADLLPLAEPDAVRLAVPDADADADAVTLRLAVPLLDALDEPESVAVTV